MHIKYLKKILTYTFFFYCALLFLQLIYVFLLSISYDNYIQAFQDFTISDWLINYEAGFVRRGLCGQILFYLYKYFGINTGHLIYFLSYLFLFVFLYLFIKEWRKNGLSIFLLPSVCLIGAFAKSDLLWFRRDILIFILIWYIFKQYKLFLTGKSTNLCYLYLLSGLTILSHEASFFYFVPLMCLHYLSYLSESVSWNIAIKKTVIFALPMLFFIFVCTIYNGDVAMANRIWHSWEDYFISEFGNIIPIGSGCKALGWNTKDTFIWHFRVNYLEKTSGIYRFTLWPFIFLSVYYLLIHVNKINICKKNNNISILRFSQILVCQFVFLLPMFTILSCDLRRVVLYWTLSSFIFYFSIGKDMMRHFGSGWFSFKIMSFNRILSTGFLGRNYVYAAIYMMLGIPFAGFYTSDAFMSSVLGNIIFITNYAVDLLRNI